MQASGKLFPVWKISEGKNSNLSNRTFRKIGMGNYKYLSDFYLIN